MKTQNVKWSCSLSNGETVYEGKGNFKRIPGELSPYLKLKRYIKEQELEITSFSLYTDDNKRWNLPSKGSNPKFKAFDDSDRPKRYKFFRKVGADVISGVMENKEVYSIIEAEFENYKLQIWVSEKEPHPSWSLII